MPQGALGAAGVRHVRAGAGLQRAAYRGGGILRGFSHSLLIESQVNAKRQYCVGALLTYDGTRNLKLYIGTLFGAL